MTTAELITRVNEYIAYDLDSYAGASSSDPPVSPSDAAVVRALNEALLDMGKAAFLVDVALPLTLVQGRAVTSLKLTSTGSAVTKPVYRVFSVVVAGNRLRTRLGGEYGLWAFAELTDCYPAWMTDAEGVPSKAAEIGNRQLALHPAPDAATAALATHYLEAQVLPKPLSTATPLLEPDLEDDLHEYVAKLAAAKLAEPNVRSAAQQAVVAGWAVSAMAKATETGRANRSAYFAGALPSTASTFMRA